MVEIHEDLSELPHVTESLYQAATGNHGQPDEEECHSSDDGADLEPRSVAWPCGENSRCIRG